MMKELTLQHVEHLAHVLAREIMTWNEPIPRFDTRFSGKLESCLRAPFQTFGGKDVYPTLAEKAAMLFYFLIKNHPFQNGNKRIAMTTLLVFLFENKKWIKADTQELYNFTLWVTQSPSSVKGETIKAIEKFLKLHWVNLG